MDLAEGIVPREEFDDATILLLLEGGAKHLPVFIEVVGLVLGATGLVFASDYGDFLCDEFLRWGFGEVPVIGWILANRVDVALNRLTVFCRY